MRKLLTQTQLSDQGTVTVDVLLLQIGQQITAAADHLEQAAAAVVVMLVGLEVLGQVVDTSGQQSNLDLRRTGVTLVEAALAMMGCLSIADFWLMGIYLFHKNILAVGAVKGSWNH